MISLKGSTYVKRSPTTIVEPSNGFSYWLGLVVWDSNRVPLSNNSFQEGIPGIPPPKPPINHRVMDHTSENTISQKLLHIWMAKIRIFHTIPNMIDSIQKKMTNGYLELNDTTLHQPNINSSLSLTTKKHMRVFQQTRGLNGFLSSFELLFTTCPTICFFFPLLSLHQFSHH